MSQETKQTPMLSIQCFEERHKDCKRILEPFAPYDCECPCHEERKVDPRSGGVKHELLDFGLQLLETRDLDPVYVLLYEAKLDRPTLLNWLLAYWCFYHVGTASWIANQPVGYWSRMRTAAGSSDYPRSPERRHFRAANALKSVEYLESEGVNRLLAPLVGGVFTADYVMKVVQQWVGFGPWIAFKVADMLERLALATIRFDNADALLFDSPKKGAEIAARRYQYLPQPISDGEWSLDFIINNLPAHRAPPLYDRPINAQEAETILCKWHSHWNGHYEVGEDILACKKGLRFKDCKLADRLFKAGKGAGLWS